MKKLIFLSLTIFLFINANAQGTKFQRIINIKGNSSNIAMKATPDGGFIILSDNATSDLELIKVNGLGNVEWSKLIGTNAADRGADIIVSKDSGYFIVANTMAVNSNRSHVMAIKTDKQGVVDWSKSFNNDSIEVGIGCLQDLTTNDFFVCGNRYTDSTEMDVFLARLNSNGTLRWYKRYGDSKSEVVTSIKKDNRGNVYMTGYTNDSTTAGFKANGTIDEDIFLIKTDDGGNMSYFKTYGSIQNDKGLNIFIDNSNNLLISGEYIGQGGDQDGLLLNINSTNGNLNSSYELSAPGDDRCLDAAINTGSGIVLAVSSKLPGQSANVGLISISTSNALQGSNFYGGFKDDVQNNINLLRTANNGFLALSTSASFGSDSALYLNRVASDLTTACNSFFLGFSYQSISLDDSAYGFVYSGSSVSNLTVNSTSANIKTDSTLCCQLDAQVAQDTIEICYNQSAQLGKERIKGIKYQWYNEDNQLVSSSPNPSVKPDSSTKYKLIVSSDDKQCSGDSAFVYVKVIPKIASSLIEDDSFCSGDNIQLSVLSNQNYYEWRGTNILEFGTNQITVNKADTISLFMIDVNSCTYRDTAKVFENPLPEFSFGNNDTTFCENEEITFSGPPNMKSYEWNTNDTTQGITTNESNTYILKITDRNNCQFSDTITTFVDPISPFELGNDTAFCEGSSFNILGPGALSKYTWNGTLTNERNLIVEEPGTYILEAFNSFGCSWNDTINITENPLPRFSLGNDSSFCEGEFYTLSANVPGTYQWSTGSTSNQIIVTNTGPYSLNVRSNALCFFTDTIFLTFNDTPNVYLGPDTTICIDSTLLLDAGIGYDSYTWNSGENTQSINVSNKGTYSVTVSNRFGCISSDEINIDTVSCDKDFIKNPSIHLANIYPNPNNGSFIIEIDQNQKIELINIYNSKGQLIFNQQLEKNNNKASISLDNIPGFYSLQVITENKTIYYQKILIKND